MNGPWRVIRWDDKPSEIAAIPLRCPHCGQTADVPSGKITGGSLVAITPENWLVFDPPTYEPELNFLPSVVQCSSCGAQLDSLELEAVDDAITVTLLHVDEKEKQP